MTQLKCVAIDDEPLALELVEAYISKTPSLKLLQTFDDPVSGSEYLRNNHVDLLFLDINMPDVTGLDLVKSLQQKPMIIFTTAYKKFAFEGFELQAIDYLLKPVEFSRFSKAVDRAVEYFKYKQSSEKEESESLFVRSEYRLIKIDLKTIEYIESLEDYIKIHLTNEKPVLTLLPLKTVLQKLPPEKFKRIHRSYIVSVSKVVSILNKKVRLLSGANLPVSESYNSFINEWMGR
jgi:DNA-binding LytR/AlgR family response regulator